MKKILELLLKKNPVLIFNTQLDTNALTWSVC